MDTVVIHSWNELQDQLYQSAYDETIDRFRSPYVFRGVEDASYPLESTLYRLGGNPRIMEHHLLRNFRKYAHRDVVETDSVWHWLAVAQHRGLPTRLLDWTYSPFVAMHFAANDINKFQMDGAIWMVNFLQAQRYLPDKLREILDRDGADVFTVLLLSESIANLSDLIRLSAEPYPLFFEPPSLDDRIVNQYALFSIMSDPAIPLGFWLQSHPELVRKLVIPAKMKWELRDKLDQSNVTERVLFPGLDGLSMWLKRQYSQKNPSRCPTDDVKPPPID
ncbi:MAG: FRG domain-containing protein [Anaerolineaceae bacterium]|nr:FRG domain-containing protein [Anaerolineaceae bacterium]